jgi:hypothetical protein
MDASIELMFCGDLRVLALTDYDAGPLRGIPVSEARWRHHAPFADPLAPEQGRDRELASRTVTMRRSAYGENRMPVRLRRQVVDMSGGA